MSRIRPVLKSVLLLNSTVMALVPLHAAHAQDRSRSTTLDEIVIMGVGETSDGGGLKLKRPASTASRLKMTPLQTPASVDVIDKETIAKRGQTDVVEAITQNATGVSSVAPEALGTAYAMRGFQGNNSVMQLYDGTRMFPGRGNVTFPFDTWTVEQIDVLHGPASVLYGEGAIGGVINIVPKKPFSGQIRNAAELTLDSNLRRRTGFDSGGSIDDRFSYRFNLVGDASNGWIDDGDSSNLAFSGALRFAATPELAFTLSTDYGRRRPTPYFGTPLRDGVIDESVIDKNYNVSDALVRFNESWTQFKTEWTPSDAVSVTNTLYYLDSTRRFRNAETYNWDTVNDIVEVGGFSHIRQEQSQIGNRSKVKLDYDIAGHGNQTVVGMDINHATFRYASYFPFAIVPVDPHAPETGGFPDPDRLDPQFRSRLNQVSVFAENRLVATDKLALVGGLRYDTPSLKRESLTAAPGDFSRTFHAVGYRLGAVYTPASDLAVYAQYAYGTDPVNVPLLDYLPNIKDFELTKGRQIEVGVKQSFWNGRGQWTVSAYQIVKNNLLVMDPATYQSVQIGEQSSRGIEAAVSLQPVEGLTVGGNIAYLDARYDRFEYLDPATFNVVDYSGKTPILVPEVTGNLWAAWDFAERWTATAGLQYVGESFEDFGNTVKRKDYALVNVGLAWKPNDTTTVNFRVKNLFDKVYAQYLRYDLFDQTLQAYIGQPRIFEASVRLTF